MEIDKNKFSLAAAATMGIWYVLCASLVALAPETAVKLFNWMVHMVNLETSVSFPEVIYGFIEAVVFAYITAYVFVWLYNRLIKTF